MDMLELKQDLRLKLIDAIDSVRGKKTLIIDPDLSSSLNLIIDYNTLKEHGVEKTCYINEDTEIGEQETNLLFIMQPNINKAVLLAGLVKSAIKKNFKRNISIKLVPRKTILFEKILEEEGILGEVFVKELKINFIPLEKDMITMNFESTFKELYLDGDFSKVYHSTRALMEFQTKYGLFPKIYGKGDYANMLADNLVKMRTELTVKEDEEYKWRQRNLSPEFDALVIIDRAVDLVTPLLTQLTYAGIVDEYYGIQNEAIQIDEVTNRSTGGESAFQRGQKKRKIKLNSNDKVYTILRDKSFAEVGEILSQKAKGLQVQYEDRHKANTISEVREYVKGVGAMQAEQHSLQTHVVLAKQLVEFTQSEEFIKINEIEASLIEFSDLTKEQLQYIEELITKCDPFFMDEESHRNHNKLAIVLRIVCLYSLIKGPKVKRKYFEKFHSLIIGAMGFQHAITLKRLSRLEIFEPPAPSTSFASTLFFSRSFTNPSAQSSTPSSGSGYNSTTKNVGGGSGTKGNGDLLDDEGLSALPSTKPSNPSTSDTFSFLRTSLKLYPNAHPHSADDVGKFYNGYVPISIRLIQCLTRDNKILSDYNSNAKSSYVGINVGFNSNINRDSDSGLNVPGGVVFGWKGFEDILQNIPGKTVELIQYSSSTSLLQPAYSDPPSSNTTPVKSTLLFFLGGITLAEISAIRYLSQKQNHNYIIATTDIINGNSLINSIMDV